MKEIKEISENLRLELQIIGFLFVTWNNGYSPREKELLKTQEFITRQFFAIIKNGIIIEKDDNIRISGSKEEVLIEDLVIKSSEDKISFSFLVERIEYGFEEGILTNVGIKIKSTPIVKLNAK